MSALLCVCDHFSAGTLPMEAHNNVDTKPKYIVCAKKNFRVIFKLKNIGF